MELRGPDVATSITGGPSAAGARPRIPCETKSILGVLLQLDNAFLHSGFNTPHIIGYIWWYFGTSNVAFVDVYRMCAAQEHGVTQGAWPTPIKRSAKRSREIRRSDWAKSKLKPWKSCEAVPLLYPLVFPWFSVSRVSRACRCRWTQLLNG